MINQQSTSRAFRPCWLRNSPTCAALPNVAAMLPCPAALAWIRKWLDHLFCGDFTIQARNPQPELSVAIGTHNSRALAPGPGYFRAGHCHGQRYICHRSAHLGRMGPQPPSPQPPGSHHRHGRAGLGWTRASGQLRSQRAWARVGSIGSARAHAQCLFCRLGVTWWTWLDCPTLLAHENN